MGVSKRGDSPSSVSLPLSFEGEVRKVKFLCIFFSFSVNTPAAHLSLRNSRVSLKNNCSSEEYQVQGIASPIQDESERFRQLVYDWNM